MCGKDLFGVPPFIPCQSVSLEYTRDSHNGRKNRLTPVVSCTIAAMDQSPLGHGLQAVGKGGEEAHDRELLHHFDDRRLLSATSLPSCLVRNSICFADPATETPVSILGERAENYASRASPSISHLQSQHASVEFQHKGIEGLVLSLRSALRPQPDQGHHHLTEKSERVNKAQSNSRPSTYHQAEKTTVQPQSTEIASTVAAVLPCIPGRPLTKRSLARSTFTQIKRSIPRRQQDSLGVVP